MATTTTHEYFAAIDIAQRFGQKVKKQRKGYMMLCPAHKDKNPSLWVVDGEKSTVLKCHRGCAKTAVAAAWGIEMKNLFRDPPSHDPSPEVAANTRYFNYIRDGKTVFTVKRIDYTNGKKKILQMSGESYKLPPALSDEGSRPLYKLPELLGAPDAPVLVVEGEPHCDALVPEIIAVTTSQGAGKASYTDLLPLTGREVILCPDNDEPGQRHMRDIGQRLLDAGQAPERIRWLALEGLDLKGDVLDWMKAGHDLGELKDLMGTAPAWIPAKPRQATEEPLLTPDAPHPLPVFPVEVFPPAIRAFIEEQAAAIPVPPQAVGIPVLSALAAAIGTKRTISPKEDWEEYPCLYMAIVADSGVGKSPAIQAAFKPVFDRQWEEEERYRKEKVLWQAAADGTPPPVQTHNFTTNATVEAIAGMLSTSPNGLVFYQDELTAWLHSMNQYRQGADREFWLTQWSHAPQKVDRKGGQESMLIPHPLVNVIGGLTPGHFKDFAGHSEAEAGDGFYQRILFTYVPDTGKVSRQGVKATTKAKYVDLVNLLWDLPQLAAAEDGHASPQVAFEPQALEDWWIWNESIASQRGTLAAPLKAKWSKLDRMSLRLTLILHEAWHAGQRPSPIDIATVNGALRLTEYFMDQDKWLFAEHTLDAAEKRDRAAWEWLKKRQPARANARDLQRNNVAGIKKAAEAKTIMQSLVDRAWVKKEDDYIVIP